jgi:hypothetical protein
VQAYTVDSLDIAQLAWPHAVSYKLASLHEDVLGERHADAHNALANARAARRILSHPRAAARARVMLRPWTTFLSTEAVQPSRGVVVVGSTRGGVRLCTARVMLSARATVEDVCALAGATLAVAIGERIRCRWGDSRDCRRYLKATARRHASHRARVRLNSARHGGGGVRSVHRSGD